MKNIIIKCEDKVELKGTLYANSNPKAAILISPATGIKRHFYKSFAEFLSENDYAVLTFDN